MNKELIKGENAMKSQEGMRNTSGSKVSFEQVEGQLIHEKKGKDVCAPRVYLWNGVGQSVEGIPTCQLYLLASSPEDINSKRADNCLPCYHYNLNT